jgi:hypothetical protein
VHCRDQLECLLQHMARAPWRLSAERQMPAAPASLPAQTLGREYDRDLTCALGTLGEAVGACATGAGASGALWEVSGASQAAAKRRHSHRAWWHMTPALRHHIHRISM